jgi:hypothetical protein
MHGMTMICWVGPGSGERSRVGRGAAKLRRFCGVFVLQVRVTASLNLGLSVWHDSMVSVPAQTAACRKRRINWPLSGHLHLPAERGQPAGASLRVPG